MKNWMLGVFTVAHGWAHIWYVILSQRLIEFKEEMGWTGQSWLLSGFLEEQATRMIATLGYSISLIGFVAGGVAMLLGQDWWTTAVTASAILSSRHHRNILGRRNLHADRERLDRPLDQPSVDTVHSLVQQGLGKRNPMLQFLLPFTDWTYFSRSSREMYQFLPFLKAPRAPFLAKRLR